MPDEYIDAPIEFDEVALYQRGIARIQSYFPNWTPKQGSMIDLLLRTGGEFAAIGAEVASTVTTDVFRTFGQLAGNPPVDASPATVTATFTAQDTNGYDVPSGTPVGLVVDGVTMDPVGFETLGDATIPNGSQTINILLQATIPGANTSGLNSVVRADTLGYITAITLQGASQGGTDAELTPDYLNRLSSDFQDWTTTPIRGNEYARKARDIQGIYRCAYWENYNPADGTVNNDKYVALCPIDINGADIGDALRQSLVTYLGGLREVNFVPVVVSPLYSSIDVTGRLHLPNPSLQAQAITDALAALNTALFPGNWGIPQTGAGQAPQWINSPVIRISKITSILDQINNVDYADQVEIGFSNPPPPTPAPTTNQAGGTIAAGVYSIVQTYVNANGETIGSNVAVITTLVSTSTISIPSPPQPTGSAPVATGWYAYVSQLGGQTVTRQQAAGAPTAIGTTLTLTAPPSADGANPPTVNPRLGVVDLNMPGAFPLPEVGALSITAVTP